jgi:aryl-alcohol dehydrogenase-like predicted oxidoreductase
MGWYTKAMKTNKIGSLDATVVGLGTNNFGFSMDQDEVDLVFDRAIEAGINFFDTADSYMASESQRPSRVAATRS